MERDIPGSLTMQLIEAKSRIQAIYREGSFDQDARVGEFSRAFIERLAPQLNADEELDRYNVPSTYRELRRFNRGVGNAHLVLWEKNPEFQNDVNTILSSRELDQGAEGAIQRMALAGMYYISSESNTDFNKAYVWASLFAESLREEIATGENIKYKEVGTDSLPRLFSRLRIFVKAALIADRGLDLRAISIFLNRGKPMKAPEWLLRWMQRKRK